MSAKFEKHSFKTVRGVIPKTPCFKIEKNGGLLVISKNKYYEVLNPGLLMFIYFFMSEQVQHKEQILILYYKQ